MSFPDTTFDAVEGLRDIQLPDGVSAWPLAPGWWLLGLFVFFAVVTLVLIWHRRNALRREALRQLSLIHQDYRERADPHRLCIGLSTLLRRVALARAARSEVAGLVGADWLDYLDRRGGAGDFSDGPGKVLRSAPYGADSGIDSQALLQLVHRWIVANT